MEGKVLPLGAFFLEVEEFKRSLDLCKDSNLALDTKFRINNITPKDNIEQAKSKVAFDMLWRLFTRRDGNIMQKVKSFLDNKLPLKMANITYNKCIRASEHSLMYNFAWKLYSDLGDNPSTILSKYRFNNYLSNCRIRPGSSRETIAMKLARGIFWHAFTYHNKDIEQRITSFICDLFGPIAACMVYEICMIESGRGSFKNQGIILHMDTSDGMMNIECKNLGYNVA